MTGPAFSPSLTMPFDFHSIFCRGLLAAALLHAPAYAAPAPPIEHFFENDVFSDAILAPDARSLAVRFSSAEGRDMLGVFDLATNKLSVVANPAQRDVGRFEWVNSQRLVFDAADKSLGEGDMQYAPGLFAVNRDGTHFRRLVHVDDEFIQERRTFERILPWNHYLSRQKGAQNSNDVYVLGPRHRGDNTSADITLVNLLKLDTLTGRSVTIARPGTSMGWMLDHKGEPRLTWVIEKNIETIHYLDPATGKWRQLASFDAYVGGPGAFDPLGFGPRGELYVRARAGKDKTALHTFDLTSNTISPAPLVELDGFDFSGSLVTSADKLLGVQYVSDARATVWFDETMKKVQAAVDAKLPDTVNLISVAARPETPWVLVVSYSDRQPKQYGLYNTSTGAINPIGATHPRIVPVQMGRQELVRYKARDGLMVPAWLTRPAKSGGKQLPLVVLVHGGPNVRGAEWGFDEEVQFLASRGYAVLQPEFRGSKGFGAAHFRAGWKQWGLTMQDDIADGARWAIAEGIADPKRICIAGASYGGYATVMGLIKDPDLFKCGVNWVGVSDIKLMYNGHWRSISDISENAIRYGLPALIGDPVKDEARFTATSPLAQAARVQRPLLMAYGGVDTRVPVFHGKQLYTAVKPHNPDVELIIYEEEGHGWHLPKNKIDFWGRVEKFLERHIGGAAR